MQGLMLRNGIILGGLEGLTDLEPGSLLHALQASVKTTQGMAASFKVARSFDMAKEVSGGGSLNSSTFKFN